MNKRLLRLLLVVGATLAAAPLSRAGFVESLTPAQREALGLTGLTPGQAAAVDDAVEAYSNKHDEVVATKAAVAAVAEYKQKEEPAAIAKAVASGKAQAKSDEIVRIIAHVTGKFSGWAGATLFPLDNGQTWQQVGTDSYFVAPISNASIEILRAPSGYFRLYFGDAPWVTVRRVR
jgi:hypothetical protein